MVGRFNLTVKEYQQLKKLGIFSDGKILFNKVLIRSALGQKRYVQFLECLVYGLISLLRANSDNLTIDCVTFD
jgi:hypothetical protein